ncbi:S8 family serine peptidase [Flavihumibacter sp. R14]|nr:S8 family serine peptidase [Flavihumibacter soli]
MLLVAQTREAKSQSIKFPEILQKNSAINSEGVFLVKMKPGKEITSTRQLQVLRRLDHLHFIVKTATVPASRDIEQQSPANSLWKASDNLLSEIRKPAQAPLNIMIVLAYDLIPAEVDFSSSTKVTIDGRHVSLTIKADQIETLLNHPAIVFADLRRRAKEETLINNLDLSVNQVNRVHSSYPQLNGKGLRVSLKEQLFNFEDLDLLGKAVPSPDQSPALSAHATVMATLVGGSGNSFIKGLGAAPAVQLVSSDYADLSPDETGQLQALRISVQNHSYGTGIENYYGAEAQDYDRQIYLSDTLMHVFSSGNSGASTPATGLYAGIANYANLTGTFKQAKNVLVVGGTNNESFPEALSSAGPAYDGRIKPELVTAGEEGTSGAAALTSGVVVLLQQQYRISTGLLPSSALLKSVLLNSADDIAPPYPDYKSGYGKLNAYEAIRTIAGKRFFSGSLTDKEEQIHPLTIGQDGEIKVTLAWNDTPAQLNSPSALINDLDLWIEDQAGTKILPWVLSSYPHPDSLAKPAIRRRDSLNNVEQVSWTGVAGDYKIHVRGNRVSSASQGYYVSYQAKEKEKFEWSYPVTGDQLFAGEENYLRWENSMAASGGVLSVSYDKGSSWLEIAPALLKTGFLKWETPDKFSQAILKMSVQGKDFVSDPFSISSPMTLNVGYNCDDAVLLTWPKNELAAAYNIYTIKDNVLQLLKTTADTSAQLSKPQEVFSDYYAVSPVHETGFEGIKSLTINAAEQGVKCYFQSLLADITADKNVSLSISLGTTVGLKNIRWEKRTGPDSFGSLGVTSLTSSLTNYTFIDQNPRQGIQYYRAILETVDGRKIISDLASVIVLNPYNFTVYPNPTAQSLTVLSGTIDDFEFTIFNSQGQKLSTELVNNINQTFSVEHLQNGVYVYMVSLKGKPLFRGKFIKI